MRKKRRNRCLAVLLAVAVAAGNMTMVQAKPTDAQSAGVSRQTVEDPESYYNVWWDFEGSIWENIPIGTSVIEPGGTSPATLALADENAENQYMSVKGEGGGKYRVSKLDLNSPALSGAEISFDWKPVSSEETASRFGDIGFFASESPYAYFGLQFDRDLKLHYYTVGEKVNADYSLSYSDETLEGGYQRNSSVDSGTARDTGITADGSTWYTVRLTFDYLSHTASLVIVPRDTPDTILFSESDIPIYGSVQDLASMSVGGWKCAIEMGMDNLGIKYLTDFPPEYYYNVYWNDFEEDIWPSVAIGNDIIAEGGTSPATLTVQQEEQGNQYMYVAGEGGGKYRVSKLDVSNEAASGAEVTFDWMPAAIQDTESRFGDVAFYSTDNTYAYFGLQFDKNFRIHYYTMGENVEQGYGLSYSDEVLEGGYQRNSSVDSGTARDTGITADGSTWYTVKIDFNYDSHTASLTLTERENPEMILFQESDIPIYASAVNVSMISAGAWKAESSMGLDNMGIRYRYSDASTIVAVEQPENVTVLAEKWEEHVAQRPTQAVVTLGDNSTMILEIGEWTSEPAFDPEVYGTYTWTAPLMVPEGIRNPKNLA